MMNKLDTSKPVYVADGRQAFKGRAGRVVSVAAPTRKEPVYLVYFEERGASSVWRESELTNTKVE
jgi:hypothetical protein